MQNPKDFINNVLGGKNDAIQAQKKAIEQGAAELGIDPIDYATAISYESAGSFDPWKAGPVTKWGQHRGTIQYGEPQRKKYGVHANQTFAEQVTDSNVRYLRDAGVKPGMTFEQVYAAINGGNVNRNLNTVDANTGRTIKDNINKALREHRANVIKRFGWQDPVAGFISNVLGNGSSTPNAVAPKGDTSQRDAAAFVNSVLGSDRKMPNGTPSPTVPGNVFLDNPPHAKDILPPYVPPGGKPPVTTRARQTPQPPDRIDPLAPLQNLKDVQTLGGTQGGEQMPPLAPLETVPQRQYQKRDIRSLPQGSGYYQFETGEAPFEGGSYLGMSDGKHYAKDADGDEYELAEGKWKPVGRFPFRRTLEGGVEVTRLGDASTGRYQTPDGKIMTAVDDGSGGLSFRDESFRQNEDFLKWAKMIDAPLDKIDQSHIDAFNSDMRTQAQADNEAAMRSQPGFDKYEAWAEGQGKDPFDNETINAYNEFIKTQPQQKPISQPRQVAGQNISQSGQGQQAVQPTQQPTQGRQTQPADKGVRAYVNWSGGSGSAREEALDNAASNLSAQLGVDYDIVLDELENANFAEGELTEDIARRKKAQRRQISIGLDAKAVQNVKDRQHQRNQTKAALEARTKVYEEYGDIPSVAQLKALKDEGIKEFKGKPIDEVIQNELDAFRREEEALGSEAGYTSGRLFEDGSDIVINNPQKRRFSQEEINDVLRDHGSFTEYERERKDAESRYDYRPLAAPLEMTKGIASSVPKGVSAILKTADILSEINPLSAQNVTGYVSGKKFKATEGALFQTAVEIESRWDKEFAANKDLQSYYQAGDTLGQMGIQIASGILTGGMAVPLMYGASLGASSQYEEADKMMQANKAAGKEAVPGVLGGIAGEDAVRKGAAILGGVTAISDALPLAWALKPLRKGAISRMTEGLLNSVFRQVSKESGEQAAQDATKTLFKRLVNRSITVGKGIAGEVGQEVLLDKKPNDLYASLSYDPKRKVFEINKDDLETAFYAAIGGGASGVARVKIEDYVKRQGEMAEDIFDDITPPAQTPQAGVIPTSDTAQTVVPEAEQTVYKDKQGGTFELVQPDQTLESGQAVTLKNGNEAVVVEDTGAMASVKEGDKTKWVSKNELQIEGVTATEESHPDVPGFKADPFTIKKTGNTFRRRFVTTEKDGITKISVEREGASGEWSPSQSAELSADEFLDAYGDRLSPDDVEDLFQGRGVVGVTFKQMRINNATGEASIDVIVHKDDGSYEAAFPLTPASPKAAAKVNETIPTDDKSATVENTDEKQIPAQPAPVGEATLAESELAQGDFKPYDISQSDYLNATKPPSKWAEAKDPEWVRANEGNRRIQHRALVKEALKTGDLTQKRAAELGHFEVYPELAESTVKIPSVRDEADIPAAKTNIKTLPRKNGRGVVRRVRETAKSPAVSPTTLAEYITSKVGDNWYVAGRDSNSPSYKSKPRITPKQYKEFETEFNAANESNAPSVADIKQTLSPKDQKQVKQWEDHAKRATDDQLRKFATRLNPASPAQQLRLKIIDDELARRNKSISDKEFWEMPLEEFAASQKKDVDDAYLRQQHQAVIRRAMRRGHTIPPDVLADHPDVEALQTNKPKGYKKELQAAETQGDSLLEKGPQIISGVYPELGYIQARKGADGKYRLYYTGTTNEVFQGETFRSAAEARNTYKAVKAKNDAAIKQPAVETQAETPVAETQAVEEPVTEKQAAETQDKVEAFAAKHKVPLSDLAAKAITLAKEGHPKYYAFQMAYQQLGGDQSYYEQNEDAILKDFVESYEGPKMPSDLLVEGELDPTPPKKDAPKMKAGVHPAASILTTKEPSRFVLAAYIGEKGKIVATDGPRLLMLKDPSQTGERKWYHGVTGNEIPNPNKPFPNYEGVVPDPKRHAFVAKNVDVQPLINRAKRALDVKKLQGKSAVVFLTFDTPTGVVSVNAQYLYDGLRILQANGGNKADISFGDADNQVIDIRNENARYLLMSLRGNGYPEKGAYVKMPELPLKEVNKPKAKRKSAKSSPDETLEMTAGGVESPLDAIYNEKGEIDYEQVKDVAERVERGELEISRLDRSGEQGRIAGGKRALEASIILAADEASRQEASQRGGTGLAARRDAQRRQEHILEQYAKREGIWYDWNKFFKDKHFTRGGEAFVYMQSPTSVAKTVAYRHIDKGLTPQRFLDDRIALYNHIFPGSKYELMGFTKDPDGQFRFLVKQQFFEGYGVSKAEVDAYMQGKGFTPSGRESYSNGLYQVHDVHEKNALKDADGNILVIDAVPKLADDAYYADFDLEQETGEILEMAAGSENILDSIYNEDGDIDYEQVQNAVDRVLSGEYRIKRLDLAGEEGRTVGDNGLLIGSSLIIGGETRTGEKREARKQRNREEELLEAYARTQNAWVDDIDAFRSSLNYIDRGMEAKVYEDPENPGYALKTVPISFIPDEDSSILRFFDDKIALHNALPNTAPYELVGFARDWNTTSGETFLAILRQPYIKGEETRELHNDFVSQMQADSFVLDYTGSRFTGNGLNVLDITNHNVVKAEDGKYIIFDPIVSYQDNSQYQRFDVETASDEILEMAAGEDPEMTADAYSDFLEDGDFDENGNVKPEALEDIRQDREAIEKQAKADGTWLKAPNGKDSNLTPFQWVEVRTKRFKRWFGDWENDPENASQVIDENGEPLVVYHGTTHDFDAFDSSKGNIESHFGRLNYFTDSLSDLMANYAGDGADLTSRIERLADQLLDTDAAYGSPEYKKALEDARSQARSQIAGKSQGLSLSLFANIRNPLYLTEDSPTRFDALDEYNAESDEYTENPDSLPMKLYKSLFSIQSNNKYYDFDARRVWDDVSEQIGEWDSASAVDVDEALRNSEGLAYATDENGDLAGNEIIKTLFIDGLGFDGIVLDADMQFGARRRSGQAMTMDADTRHYHVLDSNQIKSAIGNQGTYSDAHDEILEMAAGEADTFYSQVERVIEQKMPNKASAEQIKGILSPNNGVKAEELEWLDIDTFLAERSAPNPIKASQAQDYRKSLSINLSKPNTGPAKMMWGNEEQVEEYPRAFTYSTRGTNKQTHSVDVRVFRPVGGVGRRYLAFDGDMVVAAAYVSDNHELSSVITEQGMDRVGIGTNLLRKVMEIDPKVTPVGDASQEGQRLLKRVGMPVGERRPISKQELLDYVRANNVQVEEVVKGGRTPKENDARFEALEAIPSAERTDAENEEMESIARGDWRKTQTKFSQWVLSGGENYRELLLTMPERPLPADTRTFPALSEAENDRRQYLLSGRRLTDAEAQELGELNRRRQLAQDEWARPKREDDLNYKSSHWDEPNVLAHVRYDERDGGKTLHIAEIQSDWGQALRDGKDVPQNFPFKKSWHEFAFKRMLRYAVENGYERVTWDTGETNAERFQLSKQVANIIVRPPRDGAKDVTIYPKQGREIHITVGNNGTVTSADAEFNNKPLDEVIGKEMAEKIMSAEFTDQRFVEFKGDDLKVGGEGMKGFYDKMLPAFVNKYTKKWGGKVEQSELNTGVVHYQTERYDGTQDVAHLPGTDYFQKGDWLILRDGIVLWNQGRASEYAASEDAIRDFLADSAEAESGFLAPNVTGLTPVHSLTITDAMRESVMQGQPLFKTGDSTAMRKIKDADTGELAVNAEYTQDGSMLVFDNLDAYGLFVQFLEEATQRPFNFFGLTVSGGTIDSVRSVMDDFIKTADKRVYSQAEIDGIISLRDAFSKAAATHRKPTVRLILSKNAVPEESFHEQAIQQAVNDNVASQNSKEWAKRLDANPLFKKALEGKFGRDYKKHTPAIRRHEFIAKLATGQLEYLGIDPVADHDAAVDALYDWMQDFQSVNPDVDWTQFEKINETTKFFIDKFQQRQQQQQRGTESNVRDTQDRADGRDGGTQEEADKPDADTQHLTEDGREGVRGSETDGSEGSGQPRQVNTDPDAFTPSGKVKLSETPKSLRGKADIPVSDREYVSTSNPAQIEYANSILDGKSVEEAEAWFKEQVAGNNMNSGGTVAVGLTLMNRAAKEGRIDDLNELADRLVPFVTDVAQSLQAMSIVSMFNPSMAASYAAKIKKQRTGKDLTQNEAEKAAEIATRFSEAAAVEGVSEEALRQAEESLKALNEELTAVQEAEKAAVNRAVKLKGDLSEANKTIKKLQKRIERLLETRPTRKRSKLIKQLEKDKENILARLKAKYQSPILEMTAADEIFEMAAGEDIDPDLVDFAVLTLAEGRQKLTPREIKQAIEEVSNGELTPEQIDEVYAAGVMKLMAANRPDPLATITEKEERRKAMRRSAEHTREAKRIIDGWLKDANSGAYRKDAFVDTIIKEGILNDYSDEVIFTALVRKNIKEADAALARIREEYPDMSREQFTSVLAEANTLLDDAKTALTDMRIRIRNDIQMTQENVENVKKERADNRRISAAVRREAERFYRGLSQSRFQTALDTAVNLRRANLLTGIKTHERNLISTGLHAASLEAERVAGWIADIALSRYTGRRSTGFVNPRSVAKGIADIVKQDETLKNIDRQSGLQRARDWFRYGGPVDEMERLQISQSVAGEKFGKIGKALDSYINTVFNTLGGEDALFKAYAFRRALEEAVDITVANEYKSDKSLDKEARRKELILNPTNEMIAVADEYAEFLTFQNQNAISATFSKFKNWKPLAKAISEIVVPYDRTPTNIVLRVLEHTPVGFAMAAKKAYNIKGKEQSPAFRVRYRPAIEQDIESREDFNKLSATEKRELVEKGLSERWSLSQQRDFARIFGSATTGTGILLPLGWFLAANGLLAGVLDPGDDDDRNERNAFFEREKMGVHNRSLLLGKFRITLPDDPALRALTAGATMYEQTQLAGNAPLMETFKGGVETAKNLLSDQPLLSGTDDLYTRIRNGDVGGLTGNILGGLIPTFVSDVGEVLDEKPRKASGYMPGQNRSTLKGELEYQGRSFRNPILRRVPVLRQYYVPESTSSVSQEERGDTTRRLVRALDMFNVRQSHTDPFFVTSPEVKPLEDRLKSASTDKIVDMLKYDPKGKDAAALKTILHQKARNAQKAGSLTPEEVKRIKEVIPEFKLSPRVTKK